MKTTSVAAAAVLAGVAIAQPHGHHGHQHRHAKRELVVEWETVWETVTVIVDESTTQTFLPTHTTSGIPGEFFQPISSTSTPEPQPEPTVAETTSVKPLPTTTAAASSSSSSSSSSPPPPPPPTTTPLPEPKPEPTPEPEPEPTPEPTPEPEPVPEPKPTSVAPPPPPVETPTPEPAPQGSGSSYAGSDAFGTSSMDSAKYAGDITYYALGLGACGYDDSGVDQTQHIVALSKADWFNRGSGTSLGIDMPNHAWCDQTITISGGGKTTTALVHDICPGCAPGSIDVSEAVFTYLYGSLGAGREQITWSFN